MLIRSEFSNKAYEPPILVISQNVMKENSINFLIKYQLNPRIKFQSVVLTLRPLEQDASSLRIISCESQPKGEWDINKGELCWHLNENSPSKLMKLMVICNTNLNPKTVNFALGYIRVEFTIVKWNCSQITVDTTDNLGTRYIFEKGVVYSAKSGDYKFLL